MSFKFKLKSPKSYKQQKKTTTNQLLINYFLVLLKPHLEISRSAFNCFDSNVTLISYQELSHELKLHQILSKKLPLLSKQFLIIYDFSKQFCCYHDNKKNILYTNQPKNEISKALIKLFNIKNQVQKYTNCLKEFCYSSKTKFDKHIYEKLHKCDTNPLKKERIFTNLFCQNVINTILTCFSVFFEKYINNIIEKIKKVKLKDLHSYIIDDFPVYSTILLTITDDKKKTKEALKFIPRSILSNMYYFIMDTKSCLLPHDLIHLPLSYIGKLLPKKIVYGVQLSKEEIIRSLCSTDPKKNKISLNNTKSIDVFYSNKNEWINIYPKKTIFPQKTKIKKEKQLQNEGKILSSMKIKRENPIVMGILSKPKQKNKQKQRAFSFTGIPSYKAKFLKSEKNKKTFHKRHLTL